MTIDLNKQDIEVIRTSLEFSKHRVSSERETPPEVRKENIERIDTVLRKLPRVAARIDD